jgi:DNA polymerase elongation subunit (family B)
MTMMVLSSDTGIAS